MRRTAMLCLTAALVVTGCSTVRESRFNPFNWFGNSRSQAVVADDDDINALIPRRSSVFAERAPAAYSGQPIGEITELLVERRPGGAILRATGLADRPGPFDARLTRDEDETEAGTLSYTFRVLHTRGSQGVAARARLVTVAISLTDQDLAGIRTIRVKGARNQRVTSR